jgi:hypothetical protein
MPVPAVYRRSLWGQDEQSSDGGGPRPVVDCSRRARPGGFPQPRASSSAPVDYRIRVDYQTQRQLDEIVQTPPCQETLQSKPARFCAKSRPGDDEAPPERSARRRSRVPPTRTNERPIMGRRNPRGLADRGTSRTCGTSGTGCRRLRGASASDDPGVDTSVVAERPDGLVLAVPRSLRVRSRHPRARGTR